MTDTLARRDCWVSSGQSPAWSRAGASAGLGRPQVQAFTLQFIVFLSSSPAVSQCPLEGTPSRSAGRPALWLNTPHTHRFAGGTFRHRQPSSQWRWRTSSGHQAFPSAPSHFSAAPAAPLSGLSFLMPVVWEAVSETPGKSKHVASAAVPYCTTTRIIARRRPALSNTVCPR